ncbi:hypothetical protein C8Q74DRAFT_735273 [Fomes fomentarius]|nr:hypothetical protein C8Q74DRAFT_735273 [Fomes fomentarius]
MDVVVIRRMPIATASRRSPCIREVDNRRDDSREQLDTRSSMPGRMRESIHAIGKAQAGQFESVWCAGETANSRHAIPERAGGRSIGACRRFAPTVDGRQIHCGWSSQGDLRSRMRLETIQSWIRDQGELHNGHLMGYCCVPHVVVRVEDLYSCRRNDRAPHVDTVVAQPVVKVNLGCRSIKVHAQNYNTAEQLKSGRAPLHIHSVWCAAEEASKGRCG